MPRNLGTRLPPKQLWIDEISSNQGVRRLCKENIIGKVSLHLKEAGKLLDRLGREAKGFDDSCPGWHQLAANQTIHIDNLERIEVERLTTRPSLA